MQDGSQGYLTKASSRGGQMNRGRDITDHAHCVERAVYTNAKEK